MRRFNCFAKAISPDLSQDDASALMFSTLGGKPLLTSGSRNDILIYLLRLRGVEKELLIFVCVGRKGAKQIHQLYVLPEVRMTIAQLRGYSIGSVEWRDGTCNYLICIPGRFY